MAVCSVCNKANASHSDSLIQCAKCKFYVHKGMSDFMTVMCPCPVIIPNFVAELELNVSYASLFLLCL